MHIFRTKRTLAFADAHLEKADDPSAWSIGCNRNVRVTYKEESGIMEIRLWKLELEDLTSVPVFEKGILLSLEGLKVLNHVIPCIDDCIKKVKDGKDISEMMMLEPGSDVHVSLSSPYRCVHIRLCLGKFDGTPGLIPWHGIGLRYKEWDVLKVIVSNIVEKNFREPPKSKKAKLDKVDMAKETEKARRLLLHCTYHIMWEKIEGRSKEMCDGCKSNSPSTEDNHFFAGGCMDTLNNLVTQYFDVCFASVDVDHIRRVYKHARNTLNYASRTIGEDSLESVMQNPRVLKAMMRTMAVDESVSEHVKEAMSMVFSSDDSEEDGEKN